MRGEDRRGLRIRRSLPDLPPACWAAIASHLTWEDRISLALVQRACADGVAMLERGVRLDVTRSSSSTSRALPHTLRCPNVHTVLLVSGSSAYASGTVSDEHEMWRSLDSSWKPGRVQWLLRTLTRRLGLASGRRSHMPLRRTLRLSLPSMACTTTELETALLAAGADACFSGVEVSKGLLVLDGALADRLLRANTTAMLLLPTLQSPLPYTALADLAVQVSSSGELETLLEAATPTALPALRSLALVAEPGEDGGAVRADFAALEHPGLAQLMLNSIELSFAALTHLTGLQSLAVWYEEDQGPPLNLGGELSALSALRQLSSLAVHNLASSEGLRQLPGLRSLSISPQPGSALVLEGLPHLATLSLDLSSCGSCSRELVRRSAVAYVPLGGAALPALCQVELRCFMWGRPQPGEPLPGQPGAEEGEDEMLAEGGEGAEGGGGESDDDGGGAGSDDEPADDDEEQGAPNSDSDSESEEEEEDEEGEEEEPSDDEGWEPASAGEEAAASALARLERAYLSALLARLPALESVQLSDYLGVVAPPSGSKASGGGSGLGASRAARAGGADGGWRDATGCTIAGAAWQRAVSQMPARDDGAPLCDVRYTRL